MDEKRLEEMYQMVRENNAMLRSARRSAFIGGVFKFLWWATILVVLPYLTWLYIEPYLSTVTAQYQAIEQKSGQLTSEAAGLMDLLKQFGIGGE